MQLWLPATSENRQYLIIFNNSYARYSIHSKRSNFNAFFSYFGIGIMIYTRTYLMIGDDPSHSCYSSTENQPHQNVENDQLAIRITDAVMSIRDGDCSRYSRYTTTVLRAKDSPSDFWQRAREKRGIARTNAISRLSRGSKSIGVTSRFSRYRSDSLLSRGDFD